MIVSKTKAEKILGIKLAGFVDGKWSYYLLSTDLVLIGGPYTRAEAVRKDASQNPVTRKKLYIHPNKAAITKAAKALERRRGLPKSRRGGLDPMEAHAAGIGSGVLRARDIASGKRINAYQVKAFFDRHLGNYLNAKADGKSWDESKALQAWDLWGGEPLRKQVNSAVKKDSNKG